MLYLTDDDIGIDLEASSEGHDTEESDVDESNLDPNGYEIESTSKGGGNMVEMIRDSDDEEVSMLSVTKIVSS